MHSNESERETVNQIYLFVHPLTLPSLSLVNWYFYLETPRNWQHLLEQLLLFNTIYNFIFLYWYLRQHSNAKIFQFFLFRLVYVSFISVYTFEPHQTHFRTILLFADFIQSSNSRYRILHLPWFLFSPIFMTFTGGKNYIKQDFHSNGLSVFYFKPT